MFSEVCVRQELSETVWEELRLEAWFSKLGLY